jgi:5'-3' exonuclease
MKLFFIDGTFELFRAFYGGDARKTSCGLEVGAVRQLLRNLENLRRLLDMQYLAVSFDTVIESFRNGLFPGYKTGEGIPPDLMGQFPLAEQASRGLGFVTWSMIDFEADDALATAAKIYQAKTVEQVVICTPDKDLTQCVTGKKVITYDSIRRTYLDEDGVVAKFGVSPESIPDYLGLVGDKADGIPGIPRFGAKSASTLLSRYQQIEKIPKNHGEWEVKIRGAQTLAENLKAQYTEALLFKRLATLRRDVPLVESREQLKWQGPNLHELRELCAKIEDRKFLEKFSSPT